MVFGSVQSVVRNLESFNDANFTLLVIDESHRVSLNEDASYRQVIEHLRQHNPQLKILGLTATPYRLGQGLFITATITAWCGAVKRVFRDCVFEQPLRLMVKQGYLAAPKRLDMAIEGYDFSALKPFKRPVPRGRT